MSSDTDYVKAFLELDDELWSGLLDINNRIQSHKGAWGERRGGEIREDGAIHVTYWVPDPIVSEFLEFMYDNDLIVGFNWSAWDEGREWYKNDDEAKYDDLDIITCLKLLTAVIRNDRFSDGVLSAAFESGECPKIINKLVSLRST